jgi:SNF2 family DNA or RNA helicase
MNPAALKKGGFEYKSSTKWQETYGVLESVRKLEDEEDTQYGRGKKNGKIVRKRPGVSPLVIGKHLLDKSSFIKLSDVADSLPPYEEIVLAVEMNDEQAVLYRALQNMLKKAVRKYKNKALAAMLQALLSYPDSCCFYPEYIEIKDKLTEQVLEVIEAPRIECNALLPKEAELVSLAKKEKEQGRKTLCYLTFTNSRDIRPRLKDVLEDAGLRVGILDVSVEPKKREAWIEKHSQDMDVLLVNAELVKTGLDLYQFPTVVFYQTGYNIFTVRQAARRSWRIGQAQPVKVYFLCYQNTMQEIALYLVAEKLETSLMIEGDIPEGLADYSSSSSSVFEELGKALMEGNKFSGAEEKWAKFRKKEIESQVEIGSQSPIPETKKVNSDKNIIVRITLKEGKKKKWSTLEVKLGDLDNEKFQDKTIQYALPF